MSSSATLLRRLQSIERKRTPTRAARDYVVALVEGETLDPRLAARVGPRDSLVVRMIAPGYLGSLEPEQHLAYWRKLGRGRTKATVIRPGDTDKGGSDG